MYAIFGWSLILSHRIFNLVSQPAKGLIAELTHFHVQNVWGFRRGKCSNCEISSML